MSSILDIDLDYFNHFNNPIQRLNNLLSWADCPLVGIVAKHHKVLPLWNRYIEKHRLRTPSHILHVDEHHDMMNQKQTGNIANITYRAMVSWPKCKVFWIVNERIDSPSMWLDDEVWHELRLRFRTGKKLPQWPRPDFMTICTSPEFVKNELLEQLMNEVFRFYPDT
jgi:hypothetical protein